MKTPVGSLNAHLNFKFRNHEISKSYLLLLYVLLLGKLIELLELGTPLAAAQLWEEYEKKVSGFKFSKNEPRREKVPGWSSSIVLLEKEENCNTPFAIIAIRKKWQDRQSRHVT